MLVKTSAENMIYRYSVRYWFRPHSSAVALLELKLAIALKWGFKIAALAHVVRDRRR